ncbi:uncharacterized protein [Diadema setosum]|uniref:uncharacterized protein n=1 Tax=Diadema setosum TaxID=31175 RepID=UPI003B39FDEA
MASYVGLNVGGKIYETSETTLTRQPESFFTTLLSGSVPSARDDQGNYRIDRDGKIFRYVLNYLRDNELILPEGFNELTLLEREADFYQLESLKADIQTLRVAMRGGFVSLNVGGTKYTVKGEVLSQEPDSVFQQILKDQATPVNYRYFLPGDGELFRYTLKYLQLGFLALPRGFDLTLLEDEVKILKLDVLRAHILVLKMFQKENKATRGVAMFSRRDDFVLYSKDKSTLTSVSATLLPESSHPADAIRATWIGNTQVLMLAVTLDSSRAGEPVSITTGPGHVCRYPANSDDLVVLLSVLVGMETHRKVFPSSYLGVFGLPSDVASKNLKEFLREF